MGVSIRSFAKVVVAALLSLQAVAAVADEHSPMVECFRLTEAKSARVTISPNSGFKNCFQFSGSASDEISLAYASKDGVELELDFFSATPDFTVLTRFHRMTSSRGGAYADFSTLSPETFLKIIPRSTLDTSKDLQLSLYTFENRRYLIIRAYEGQEKKNSPSPGNGGTCQGRFCFDPMESPFGDSEREFGGGVTGALTTSAACGRNLVAPPEGKPRNFKVNEHLKEFENFANSLPANVPAMKYLVLADNFYTGQTYDLKNNPVYKDQSVSKPALAEFGNWFYGAAGAVLGIEESTLQWGAAVVQQVQDYNASRAAGQTPISQSEFVSRFVRAMLTGCCDNEDDPAPISGGFAYGKEAYLPDPQRHEREDSCSTTTSPVSSNGFSEGPAGSGFRNEFRTTVPMIEDIFVEGSVVEITEPDLENVSEIRTTDEYGNPVVWALVDGEWVRVSDSTE